MHDGISTIAILWASVALRLWLGLLQGLAPLAEAPRVRLALSMSQPARPVRLGPRVAAPAGAQSQPPSPPLSAVGHAAGLRCVRPPAASPPRSYGRDGGAGQLHWPTLTDGGAGQLHWPTLTDGGAGQLHWPTLTDGGAGAAALADTDRRITTKSCYTLTINIIHKSTLTNLTDHNKLLKLNTIFQCTE